MADAIILTQLLALKYRRDVFGVKAALPISSFIKGDLSTMFGLSWARHAASQSFSGISAGASCSFPCSPMEESHHRQEVVQSGLNPVNPRLGGPDSSQYAAPFPRATGMRLFITDL